MTLSDLRSLALARAVAAELERDPHGVLQRGLDNNARWQQRSGRPPHLEASEVIDARSRDVRSLSPFAGVLS